MISTGQWLPTCKIISFHCFWVRSQYSHSRWRCLEPDAFLGTWVPGTGTQVQHFSTHLWSWYSWRSHHPLKKHEETWGLREKQGLGWRRGIYSTMYKLKPVQARSGGEWGEIPMCLHFICTVYPTITLSQLFSSPPWADGSCKHLIWVMTFSPLGPGSPGTPSSPTGPGKPGFPWKGRYIIKSFSSKLFVTNHSKEKVNF